MIQTWIAEGRIEIDQARLLTLYAAWLMDNVGNKAARTEISAIKVVAPNVALRVIDNAIQAHGGGGVSDDFPLAAMYAGIRTLRIADGPDEVHRMVIARRELRRYAESGADAWASSGAWLMGAGPRAADPARRLGRESVLRVVSRYWPATGCTPPAAPTFPTHPR